LVFFSLRLGGFGGALSWMILNLGYLAVSPWIVHRKILKGELQHWFAMDVGLPVIVTTLVVGVGRWLTPPSLPPAQSILSIALVTVTALVFAILSAEDVRAWVYSRVGILARRLYSR
jgi:hypothetical protein